MLWWVPLFLHPLSLSFHLSLSLSVFSHFQSLQLAIFLFTVCHVVIVVMESKDIEVILRYVPLITIACIDHVFVLLQVSVLCWETQTNVQETSLWWHWLTVGKHYIPHSAIYFPYSEMECLLNTIRRSVSYTVQLPNEQNDSLSFLSLFYQYLSSIMQPVMISSLEHCVNSTVC